jgi:hypothetical protein
LKGWTGNGDKKVTPCTVLVARMDVRVEGSVHDKNLKFTIGHVPWQQIRKKNSNF